MISMMVSGNIGRDAELRDTRGGKVCSFSLAVSRKRAGEQQTMWLDCSLWGERGEKLCPHLRKGTSVACLGDFWIEEREGKSYAKLTVQDLQFLGSREQRGGSSREADPPQPTMPF